MKLALSKFADNARYFRLFVSRNKLPVAVVAMSAFVTVAVGSELIVNYKPRLVISS